MIAYAGAPGGKAVVSYDAATGEPAWFGSAGTMSHRSPQVATLLSVPLVLMITNAGLNSLDPATRARLRFHKIKSGGGSGLLLVTPKSGEVALVRANPERFEELGRFAALNGKTWTHLVVAAGRLYGRNAEEMACFELAPAGVASR